MTSEEMRALEWELSCAERARASIERAIERSSDVVRFRVALDEAAYQLRLAGACAGDHTTPDEDGLATRESLCSDCGRRVSVGEPARCGGGGKHGPPVNLAVAQATAEAAFPELVIAADEDNWGHRGLRAVGVTGVPLTSGSIQVYGPEGEDLGVLPRGSW